MALASFFWHIFWPTFPTGLIKRRSPDKNYLLCVLSISIFTDQLVGWVDGRIGQRRGMMMSDKRRGRWRLLPTIIQRQRLITLSVVREDDNETRRGRKQEAAGRHSIGWRAGNGTGMTLQMSLLVVGLTAKVTSRTSALGEKRKRNNEKMDRERE